MFDLIARKNFELLDDFIFPLKNVGFDPLSISNLDAWLDSSDASTLFQDSARTTPADLTDPVGAWEDKSSEGNHAIQTVSGDRPTRETNGITGDGVDHWLQLPITVGAEKTFIIVAKGLTTSNPDRLFNFGSSANSSLFSNGTYWAYFSNEANGFETFNNSETVSERRILSFRYTDVNNAEFDSNTQSDITFDPKDTYSTSSNMQLLSLASGNNAINAEINEVILVNRAVTDSELSDIFNYLSAKWGVSLS